MKVDMKVRVYNCQDHHHEAQVMGTSRRYRRTHKKPDLTKRQEKILAGAPKENQALCEDFRRLRRLANTTVALVAYAGFCAPGQWNGKRFTELLGIDPETTIWPVAREDAPIKDNHPTEYIALAPTSESSGRIRDLWNLFLTEKYPREFMEQLLVALQSKATSTEVQKLTRRLSLMLGEERKQMDARWTKSSSKAS